MRARRLAFGLGATAAVAACGCGGADPNSGITAYLRASNAQFVEGTMPASSGGSEPAVRAVNLINTTIYPGLQNFGVSGSVEGGVSALVGLAGDSGYWILPAPQVDPVNAGNYTFATSLTFSPLLPTGPQTLVLKAVDPQGSLGPELDLPLVAKAAIPAGALVFTLTWDTQADLDLHVVIPNTADPTKPIEIWSRAPVGLPPLGPADPPYDTATTKAAPYLDFDSNAACVIDGRRQENVIFSLPPDDNSFVPVRGVHRPRRHLLAVRAGGGAVGGPGQHPERRGGQPGDLGVDRLRHAGRSRPRRWAPGARFSTPLIEEPEAKEKP